VGEQPPLHWNKVYFFASHGEQRLTTAGPLRLNSGQIKRQGFHRLWKELRNFTMTQKLDSIALWR
jgi:hypothetical protein